MNIPKQVRKMLAGLATERRAGPDEAPRGQKSLRTALTWILIGAAVALVVFLWFDRRQMARELRRSRNQVAAMDSSRVVVLDSMSRVTERFAFVAGELGDLTGSLGAIQRRQHETAREFIAIRLAFDSLSAITEGKVTGDADSAIRHLSARLDSAGMHVGVRARIPPPPSLADVEWSIRLDTIEVLQTLSETPAGQSVYRAQIEAAAGLRATVLADSIVTAERPRAFGVGWDLPGLKELAGLAALLIAAWEAVKSHVF